MNDGSDRDVVVFTDALRLPAAERADYLGRACAGDEDLRQRVETLLKLHDRVGDFLEQPPTGPGEGRIHVEAGEKPGDLIGRYKLLQQIGEGGCGVVFMAEQEEPVRRRVALKVVKPGMDTKSVIARFEAERQALALMEHPNIAHVLDAGATDSGRPYFVMELVRGSKITDYCDQKSLTTLARLDLFIQVCDAIQHAHQKGIIHRDIKPSNILVTTATEGKPLPKVIDFGIAKATTGQRLTDKTLFTGFEMLIGTPAYMSPEQAELTSMDVDTRSDIYSLGVLLYELLTSTTPFDARELLKAGLDEVRRVIRSEEPVRPSTRLSTMMAADLTSVSEHRRSQPPKLIREVRGDLDWIVIKAMEKDRSRRYQTANGLAEDVRRFLKNEVISAHAPGAWYRFWKLVGRNRIWFGAFTTISMILVAGLVAVTIALTKERSARREAVAQKNLARTEAARSEEVARFHEEMLEGVAPGVALGRDTALLRDILDKTAKRLDTELTNQPVVQADLRFRLGMTYKALAQYKEAEAMYRQALVLRTKVFGEESEAVTDVVNELVKTLNSEHNPEGERLIRKALAVRQRLLGEEHFKVADSFRILGLALLDQGRTDEAEITLRKSLAMNRRLLGNQDTRLGDTLVVLGVIYSNQGKHREAEEFFRETIDNQKPLGEDHPYVIQARIFLSEDLSAQGKTTEAETVARLAVESGHRVFGEQYPHPLLADALKTLAQLLSSQRKYEEAEQTFREALTVLQKLKADKDSGVLVDLAFVLVQQQKLEDVEQLFASLLPPTQELKPTHVATLRGRSYFFARRGRWKEAAADAAFVLQHEPDNYKNYHALAPLLVAGKDVQAYQQLCREIITRFSDTTNVSIADPMAKDCLILPSATLDLEPVAAMAQTAVTGTESLGPYPFFQSCKALAEYRQGHWAGAIDWAQRAAKNSFPYSRAEAYATLAMAQYQLNQTGNSRATLAKCVEVVETKMPTLENGDLGQDWRDWIIIHALLKEARTLIEGATTPKSNSTEQ